MSTEYIIRAALHDETNEGWVWTWDHPSRTMVRVTGPDGVRKIYCLARQIDPNFLNIYNQSPEEKERLKKEGKRHRLNIDEKNRPPTVVMGQWYRDALGILDTTNERNSHRRVRLTIDTYGGGIKSILGPLFAASHHPDIVVRLGVRLGVLGAWLGITGILPAFGLLIDNTCLRSLLAISIVFLSGGFGVWVCWPLPPSPLKPHDQ